MRHHGFGPQAARFIVEPRTPGVGVMGALARKCLFDTCRGWPITDPMACALIAWQVSPLPNDHRDGESLVTRAGE